MYTLIITPQAQVYTFHTNGQHHFSRCKSRHQHWPTWLMVMICKDYGLLPSSIGIPLIASRTILEVWIRRQNSSIFSCLLFSSSLWSFCYLRVFAGLMPYNCFPHIAPPIVSVIGFAIFKKIILFDIIYRLYKKSPYIRTSHGLLVTIITLFHLTKKESKMRNKKYLSPTLYHPLDEAPRVDSHLRDEK